MIDFHTVMKKNHQHITGYKSLMSLGKNYTLRLKIMADAVAIPDFEVLSPRFLTAT